MTPEDEDLRYTLLLYKRAVAGLVAAIVAALTCAGLLTGCSPKTVEPAAAPIIDGKEGYHVIVAGGEPEGVAAALSAARNGMKTLLVEKGDALGGLMTFGMLNFLDMNEGPNRELLTRGIFEEFYKANGNAFDIEAAKAWFMEKCRSEPNLTVMLDTEITGPVMDGKTIAGLEVREHGSTGPETIRSLAVIDATTDGDIAAAAGAPFTVGGEDYGAHGTKQGVTLVFEISGVDWDVVYDFMRKDGNPETGANKNTAWGFTEEVKAYSTVDGNMRFRAPNIARLKNGNVLINGLIIFGVDALDPESYAEGIERGQREIPHIIELMRENFVGFGNATFVRHAPRLYVRETRHFVGEYRLSVTDVLENRDHWDRIGHGSYPVDIQPTSPDNTGNCIGNPAIYSIPFRCLVPLEIDQLLIAGRSASYDSIPHGSARVIPVGMVTGEACGAAAAYSVLNSVTFRTMAYDKEAIEWLQNKLVKQGAWLVEYDPPRMAVMDHWAYPGVAVMRELGMTEGGYTNDYRLENDLPNRWALQVRANRMMVLLSERTAIRGEFRIPAWEFSLDTDEITVGQVFITAAQCASLGDREWIQASRAGSSGTIEPMSFPAYVEAGEYLLRRGVLDESDLRHFPDFHAIATYGQLLSVLGALYTVMMET